ncbi:MAG: hypothetical protein Q4B43_00550 [Bacteroidota bacterium]|nr:hypothetical protein [Bacteroidota bacterium]
MILSAILFKGCIGNMNPTGNNSSPDYPFYVTDKPLKIKNIQVPKGAMLVYDEHFLKRGRQDKALSESRLTTIIYPEGTYLEWGGVPVTMIKKFFNSEMRGYTVHANFSLQDETKKTKFSELWKSCSDELGISIKNTSDWSFNKENIANVNSCSVLYQRYFKDDPQQQGFLDQLYSELQKVK